MDDVVFNIKADEYEPDLFNDMSVQEEITVGSSENILNVYHPTNVDREFTTSANNISLINTHSMNKQSTNFKPKPVIYLQSKSNNMNNNIRTIKVANNAVPMKVFPISRSNQDNRLIRINNTTNPNITNAGSKITNVLNSPVFRNVHITKLSNFNMSKIVGNQKIVFANRSTIPTKFNNVTPINYIQASNLSQFSQSNNFHPINTHQINQATLKLEPGDSGFYNLTGGTGPTRYYPRTTSPDKDSLDGSQEQNANVYKTNGLRKYARSVCDKVKEKGTTTYSEVADELVHEYAAEHPMIPPDQLHYIQKNIRRRVYDALNVLMALKVLDKEKKEIKWKGLPINLLEECKQLEEEKSRKTELLQQRVEELSELVLQLISYKNLVGRNRQKEKEGGASPVNERIKLPFIVISTNNNTVIDCNISLQRLDYLFTFDQSFEMQDEFQTLKQSGFTLRLGTSQCTESQYKRCLELVPNTLRFYVEAIYQQRAAIIPDFLSLHRRNIAAAARSSTKISTVSTIAPVANSTLLLHNFRPPSSTISPYWTTSDDKTRHYQVTSTGSQKRFENSSSSWENSSTPKFILTMNSPHTFPNHELEDDDIEVMDEEADFPSD